jgi:serine/threonine-protein phosphatase 2A regulatory subunit A
VRHAAAVSAQAIADVLPDDVFQDVYVSMIGRLATLEWFTARISASTLMAASYKRMTTAQQQEHVQYFAALCKDETPMVRRVASQHLGSMLKEVVDVKSRSCLEEGGTVGTVLVPLYEDLASNEQPVSRSMLLALRL